MAGVLIVAAEADAGFAQEVRGQTRGLAIEIAAALPADERRTVLLVWSAAHPVGVADVPALVELWSQNRLVIARRDATPLPLGLGDLEALPAAAPAREAALKLLHVALAPDRAFDAAPARAPAVAATPPPAALPPPRARTGRWLAGGAAVLVVLVVGGALFMGQRVEQTFGPPPGLAPPPTHHSTGPTVEELDRMLRLAERDLAEAQRRAQSDPSRDERPALERARQDIEELRRMRTEAALEAEKAEARRRIEALERELAAQQRQQQQRDLYLALGGGGLVVLALAVWLVGRRRPAAAAPPPAVEAAAAAAPAPPPLLVGEMLFVSYAHRDLARVGPIVSEIEAMGKQVWFDRRALTGGPGWAGQITRAIKGSRAVVLMASPSAYASDQVVRELYLAMGAKKQIVPIELEPASLPDELEYILAPFQRHALQTGEPHTVLARALDRF